MMSVLLQEIEVCVRAPEVPMDSGLAWFCKNRLLIGRNCLPPYITIRRNSPTVQRSYSGELNFGM